MYELLIILNLVLTSALVVCILFQFHLIRGLHNAPPSPVEEEVTPHSTLGEALTITELITMREVSFDERIANIKDELAKQLPDQRVVESDAISLHPSVMNLPHDIIDNKTRGENTGVEYAD